MQAEQTSQGPLSWLKDFLVRQTIYFREAYLMVHNFDMQKESWWQSLKQLFNMDILLPISNKDVENLLKEGESVNALLAYSGTGKAIRFVYMYTVAGFAYVLYSHMYLPIRSCFIVLKDLLTFNGEAENVSRFILEIAKSYLFPSHALTTAWRGLKDALAQRWSSDINFRVRPISSLQHLVLVSGTLIASALWFSIALSVVKTLLLALRILGIRNTSYLTKKEIRTRETDNPDPKKTEKQKIHPFYEKLGLLGLHHRVTLKLVWNFLILKIFHSESAPKDSQEYKWAIYCRNEYNTAKNELWSLFAPRAVAAKEQNLLRKALLERLQHAPFYAAFSFLADGVAFVCSLIVAFTLSLILMLFSKLVEQIGYFGKEIIGHTANTYSALINNEWSFGVLLTMFVDHWSDFYIDSLSLWSYAPLRAVTRIFGSIIASIVGTLFGAIAASATLMCNKLFNNKKAIKEPDRATLSQPLPYALSNKTTSPYALQQMSSKTLLRVSAPNKPAPKSNNLIINT